MAQAQRPAFFRPNPNIEFTIANLSGELNSYDADIDIEDNQLSGGQNMTRGRATDSSIKKRTGSSLYGQFLGTTTGITGGYNSLGRDGTQDKLITYDTGIYRDVSGTWTALTSVTLTSGLAGEFAYFPLTNKTYYTNGTDNCVKYTPGASSGDQTDGSFKKGKYIIHYKNRLIVCGVSSQEDYVWYTDLGVDTFSSNNYVRVNGQVTGLEVINDFLLIFTKNRIFRVANFSFNGVASGPESVTEIPTSFGSVYQRTIKVVNGLCYFLGQDTTNKASIYVTDGLQVSSISDFRVSSTLATLNTARLTSACAVRDGFNYRLHYADTTATSNNTGILYDTVRKYFYPVEKRFLDGRADFSVMFSSETNGLWSVYAGTAGTGQVYLLNANDGLYDELPEERYLTAGSYNVPINQNPAKRAAQSFKMTQYGSNAQTVNITQAALYLKYVSGTQADLQVTIQTDNNGVPSGTVVTNGTATITAFNTSSYTWKKATFAAAVTLNGNTTYWLCVQHVTEGSGNSQYAWLGDSCTASYTAGNAGMYLSTTSSVTNTYTPDSLAISGTVYRTVSPNESFSTIRSGAGTNYVTSKIIAGDLADTTGFFPDTYQTLYRGYALFDTSALPSNAVITSASVQAYMTSKGDPFGESIGITAGTPASNTTLTAADYALANFGSTRFATDISLASLNYNVYNTWTLNASGIAAITKADITKFAFRISSDIDNVDPWTSTPPYGSFAQFSNSTFPPRLVVTYSVPTGGGSWVSDPITDQTFIIYAQSPIDAYADTKAFLPAGGREFQLQRFLTIFNTVNNYNAEVSFVSNIYATTTNFLVSLAATGGATWGAFRWGDGTLWGGSQTRTYTWYEVDGFVGRTLKMRIRNRNANQQIEFNRAVLELSPRLSQT